MTRLVLNKKKDLNENTSKLKEEEKGDVKDVMVNVNENENKTDQEMENIKDVNDQEIKVENVVVNGYYGDFKFHLFEESLTEIYARYVYIDEGQCRVDYNALKTSSSFQNYVLSMESLSSISMEQWTSNERKAFFINIYNGLVIHAIATGNEAGTSWYSLLHFFASMSYDFGPNVGILTLNEIEHGILRSNKRMPYTFFPFFKSSHPAAKYRMDPLDPRVHFAINCGAKSCPKLSIFHGKDIEDELNEAVCCFLKDSRNLSIDGKRTIAVSALFYLYSKDFGPTSDAFVQFCCNNASGPLRQEMDDLLKEEKKKYKVL